MTRAVMLVIAVIFLAVCTPAPVFAQKDDLHVYLPVNVNSKILQKEFANRCPSFNTVVFGRSTDFIKRTELSEPLATLSLQTVLNANYGYSIVSRGIKNNEDTEPYVFLTVDPSVKVNGRKKIKLGTLNILGRKPMTLMINTLLGQNYQVYPISKTEDLYTALSMGRVDALFVSRSSYEHIAENASQNLIVTDASLQFGLARFAVRDARYTEKIFSCIENFDQSFNKMLGVDSWQR